MRSPAPCAGRRSAHELAAFRQQPGRRQNEKARARDREPRHRRTPSAGMERRAPAHRSGLRPCPPLSLYRVGLAHEYPARHHALSRSSPRNRGRRVPRRDFTLSPWIPACAGMSGVWFPGMSGVRFTALSEAWYADESPGPKSPLRRRLPTMVCGSRTPSSTSCTSRPSVIAMATASAISQG